MRPEDYRRELEQQLREEAARDRRRLALRLTGWALLLAALAVVAWVAVAR
ncbi:hypothetical protein KVH27_19435 [Streptomyces olivaceus]|nr:hypothetical protein [Streptomyces olivaceus]MBZ6250541.1 hypothetical protein [Streptomyces olivaceus]